ncbi:MULTISPECIES: hypothetical protein [Trichocoleus]|uniref:Uncharacterized protein n=1 Tax=Trichocoleus desertorum GB2-A4 TaxID=2933944 RepID=A0ABV0JCW4_9CYAN|nr:hypothetical protein [Trichocoleus sp. FACHB-46]MBD1864270.1 hypothetical protein [Trichocoleus sp. FACHB-46]
MDSSKSWIIQVDGNGQVLKATPLPQDGAIAVSAPQGQVVQASSDAVDIQPRSRQQSEGSSAGWIPLFLMGAIALSVGGFIADKLFGIIQEQQKQLELERTEQKGFERGLQFQSSALGRFYANSSNSGNCVNKYRGSGRRCNSVQSTAGDAA